MWAEKIQNIRHIIDNISVQAGRYAVARAEKFISGSVFLCPSRAECCREGREIYLRERISLPKPGRMLSRGQRKFLQTADFSAQAGQNVVARAEKISTDSRFLSPSRAVCCREGRKNYLRERISLPKPGRMLSRGQRNLSQGAYFSAQAGQNAVARAEKISTDSRFLSLSRAVCCREGRENFYRQQISQSKPGVYCHVGRENSEYKAYNR